MDNKEAIKNLEFIKDYYSSFDGLTIASLRNLDFNLSRDEIEALDMAIASLKAQSNSNKCDTCVYKSETDGSNCYECVKGIQDNYEESE